jgi:hypothetical protein
MRVGRHYAESVEDHGTSGKELVRNEKANVENFLNDQVDLRKGQSSDRKADLQGLVAGRKAGQSADINTRGKMASPGPRELTA